MSVHGIPHGGHGAGQTCQTNQSGGKNSSGGTDASSLWQEILQMLMQQMQSGNSNGSNGGVSAT